MESDEIFCICQHPTCDKTRVINFGIAAERRKHLNHVVHHIEDVKETFETEERYKELKEPTREIIEKEADLFKKFFCA
jgi:hypothetical protein